MNTSLAMIYDISDNDRANDIVKIFSLLFPFDTYFYLLSSYIFYSNDPILNSKFKLY